MGTTRLLLARAVSVPALCTGAAAPASAVTADGARATAHHATAGEEPEDEAEEYLGLSLAKVRSYEAYVALEASRTCSAPATAALVTVQRPLREPLTDPAGATDLALAAAALGGVLAGAGGLAISRQLRPR